MKALLATLALVGAFGVAAAPKAAAAPASPVTIRALPGGFVTVGVGGGYVAPRPYWGVTGYTTQYQSVFLGYDQWNRPVYGQQAFRVAVYGWVYPSSYYRPYYGPRVGIGLGFRFRL